MDHITLSTSTEPAPIVQQSLTDALGTESVALKYYRLEPGATLPGGLHAHMDQEEIFFTLDGTITFTTLSDSHAISAGEAIRFAPGEYHTGGNEDGTPTTVLALGAPRETDDVRIPVSCPDCIANSLKLETASEPPVFTCVECGSLHEPQPCPACEQMTLEVRPAEAGTTKVYCTTCGHELQSAPLA